MSILRPHRHSASCQPGACGCGLTRRDFARLTALTTGALLAPCWRAHDAHARAFTGDDQPVKVGYLPITDATPLLVAHARKLFEAEGLRAEQPRLFRSWAQVVEAFVAGQVNVVHLLSPATLWVRYGSGFPAKVVAWNHVNGSALTVEPSVTKLSDFAGRTVAVPFWYSVHNVLLQRSLRADGLVPVTRARGSKLQANEVNLVVLAPAEMLSALASKAIAGYIVAEPFNAAAEASGVGKILRFSGDLWKNHACCVTFLHEQDTRDRPEWAQRVTNAIVKAQLWSRDHRAEASVLLSREGGAGYTPHGRSVLSKVLVVSDFDAYAKSGVLRNEAWEQRRIDFQPYPFVSYTEELVRALRETHVEGDAKFLAKLDPGFAARDLVDDRFVRKALAAVGGPAAFGLPPDLVRRELLTA